MQHDIDDGGDDEDNSSPANTAQMDRHVWRGCLGSLITLSLPEIHTPCHCLLRRLCEASIGFRFKCRCGVSECMGTTLMPRAIPDELFRRAHDLAPGWRTGFIQRAADARSWRRTRTAVRSEF